MTGQLTHMDCISVITKGIWQISYQAILSIIEPTDVHTGSRFPDNFPVSDPKDMKSCRTVFAICFAKCLKKPICRIPGPVGKVAKAACGVGCTAAFVACQISKNADDIQ